MPPDWVEKELKACPPFSFGGGSLWYDWIAQCFSYQQDDGKIRLIGYRALDTIIPDFFLNITGGNHFCLLPIRRCDYIRYCAVSPTSLYKTQMVLSKRKSDSLEHALSRVHLDCPLVGTCMVLDAATAAALRGRQIQHSPIIKE